MADDDLTLLAGPVVHVRLRRGDTWSPEQQFRTSFHIGRSPECSLTISDPAVSKRHASVVFEGGRWWIADLNSRNGTYLNGELIQRAPLDSDSTVMLGHHGPVVSIVIEGDVQPHAPSTDEASRRSDEESPTELLERLEKRRDDGEAGKHTQILINVLDRIKKQKAHRYQLIIVAMVVLLFLPTASYTFYQWQKLTHLRLMASEMFYTMKRVELQLGQLEEMVNSSSQAKELQEILTKRQEIKNLESKYDKFVQELGMYDKNMSRQDRAVLRVARMFGECEATMPPAFLAEVKRYIARWKTTGRLAASMQRARDNRYTDVISNAMFTRSLAPQFFYVALQESGFDAKAIGPKTRLGYAKGIWQFVPSTARDFGLKTGPYTDLAQFDRDDERFNFAKATEAAAKYIKRIYLTDAQASGLLVMASYNWGEGNVTKMIRQMPQNPQERNFWLLLKQFKIPQETYDYVFSIVAAAVIGEEPALFGFDFVNPFPHSRSL